MGLWISRQRQEYKRGKLSREKADALEALPGWKWGGRFVENDRFPGRLGELRAFVEEHGEYPKQMGKRDGERSLGKWISDKRHEYKWGKLSQERVDALEALPGWEWRTTPGPHDARAGTSASVSHCSDESSTEFEDSEDDDDWPDDLSVGTASPCPSPARKRGAAGGGRVKEGESGEVGAASAPKRRRGAGPAKRELDAVDAGEP